MSADVKTALRRLAERVTLACGASKGDVDETERLMLAALLEASLPPEPPRELWAAMADAYNAIHHKHGRRAVLPPDPVTEVIYAAVRAAMPVAEWRHDVESLSYMTALEALQIIAGEIQCCDNLMSNADVARVALAAMRKAVPQ